MKIRVKLINKAGDTIWRAIMDVDLTKTSLPPGATQLDDIAFIPMAGNVLIVEQNPKGGINDD